MPLSDIQIAARAKMRPIADLAAERLGLGEDDIVLYGRHKAKLPAPTAAQKSGKQGNLVLVTAVTPTPAGEGKTTTSVGLCDALNRIGKNTIVALREPSLGPVFGVKGGAAGGGRAQVVPMEDINLHFTGDFSAIGLSHNLLSAMIDNHIHHGNDLDLDSRRLSWKRVVDMNDRALRQIVVGLGGPGNGFTRADGFDIVVASEIMAILCLADSRADLKARIEKITVGKNRAGRPVRAAELGAAGAVSALLKDALAPNLVQTLENNPAILHGGPFANIAHGCNSVAATRTALARAEYVVTEAGFGADLGAEKFINIKCRKSGLAARAAVLVATVRAVKYHGGAAADKLGVESAAAVRKGFANVKRHLRNLREHYGLPTVVAVNHFAHDTKAELDTLTGLIRDEGVDVAVCRHWAQGGRGAVELAEKVVALVARNGGGKARALYPDGATLRQKVEAVTAKIYGASAVVAPPAAAKMMDEFEERYPRYPVCVAKTQYAFTNNPADRGIPQDGFRFHVQDVRANTGAEFIVVVGGNMMTMPGLPKKPAALGIDIDSKGRISGLF